MPELPEVEVTRQSFAAHIAGARIDAVRLGQPLRWLLGCDPERLVGRRVLAVQRRGKYLLLELDAGLLLIHLGMSGRLAFAAVLPPWGRHDHFALQTSQGSLRLHDPRRFGAVVYAQDRNDPLVNKLLARLGPEPLGADFALPAFQTALARRTAAIKQVLLAGQVVVGVGNIYASEVLFLAGIHPAARACDLAGAQVAALHKAIGTVLAQAVQRGGTTLRDFADAQGQQGHFQLDAKVYGRAHQPCLVCGDSINVLRLGQRSTFFCPTCQRLG